ncbi:MAG: DNA-processing protein DprA [Pseudomonadota bacterium]
MGKADTRATRDFTPFELSDPQRIAWLRLIRSENVGPATFRDLVNHCGSAQTALDMLPELAKRGGRMAKVKVATQVQAENEIAAITKHGAKLVGIGEPHYPLALRTMDQPPPLVTIKGSTDVVVRTAIGIVGSRNASMAGIKMARVLAGELASRGYATVSGLARGIDRAAHEESLHIGTIAVLAGGINKPYPPENLELLHEIETNQRGCSLTEQPFNWEPRAKDFPKRNRLIAGLCAGLVVVEAAQRSGSLITARIAGELGRHVMAVPGSPLDPRAQGTNGLIRNGATLVANVDDIVEAITPIAGGGAMPSADQSQLLEPDDSFTLPPPDSVRERIVGLLGPTPIDLDDIIAESDASPSEVFLVILELDLAGRVERHSGNRVSLLM